MSQSRDDGGGHSEQWSERSWNKADANSDDDAPRQEQQQRGRPSVRFSQAMPENILSKMKVTPKASISRRAISEVIMASMSAKSTASSARPTPKHGVFFEKCYQHLIPGRWDYGYDWGMYDNSTNAVYDSPSGRRRQAPRSMRRRLYLLLTEPDTSMASACFFFVLIATICLMNVLMIGQTVSAWQYTPTDCRTCGGPVSYMFDDDDSIALPPHDASISCQCPPTPNDWTVRWMDGLNYFFTIEWTLRVLTYQPAVFEQEPTFLGRFAQWLRFLCDTTTVLDALAIFPYYIELEIQTNGLMSLRLFRLFRVLQLVRLGQYNQTFASLSSVMIESLLYLKILLGVMLFLAAVFGSILYWLEKGTWQYYEATSSYEFVRTDPFTGEQSLSPFTSIPQAFWFFAVTSTSTGYGDMVPITTVGKMVTVLMMVAGVLIIAFPVSVFSDLWSKQLKKKGAIELLENESDDIDDDGFARTMVDYEVSYNDNDDNRNRNSEEAKELLPTRERQSSTQSYDSLPPIFQPPASALPGFSQSVSTRIEKRTSSADLQHIMIHRDDFAQLMAHIYTLQETQESMRRIMRKYKPMNSAAAVVGSSRPAADRK